MKCADCKNFTPPAPQYDANSLGQCAVFDRWLASFPRKHADPKTYPTAYDAHFRALGNQLFWPLADRVCREYLTKVQQ